MFLQPFFLNSNRHNDYEMFNSNLQGVYQMKSSAVYKKY